MENQDSHENESFIQRLKESPRTVSALIIILIVAAAIYAFSGEDKPKQTGQASQTATTSGAVTGDTQNSNTDQAVGNTEPTTASPNPDTAGSTTTTPTPEAHRTDKSYIEVAAAGNGVTHLARRAADRWLSENQTNYAVTKEHRIYIEDYIKDQIGSRGLVLGEEVEISFDLIQQAVNTAGQLNEKQLANLSQYTSALE